MKKSFAENCIRYISTATALILALAMLCCANFSASAKDLGSNLTITDTTLLLKDINTTTNTTPAKTKDLIASGANVDVVSTGISGTYYLDLSDNYTNWEDKSARFAICTYTTEDSNRNYTWYNMEKVSGKDHIYKATVNDSNYYINFARMNPGNTENNWTNKWNDTGDLTPETGKNCYKVKSGAWDDKGGGTWSTYSSATTYTVTFNYNGHGTNTSETVDSNTQINAPTAPTETGYTFGGWYTDESLTTEVTFPYTVTSNVTFYAKWTENASSTVSADIISVLKGEKIMFYIGNSWGSTTMYHRTSSGSSTDNGTSTSSTVEINKVTCNYGVVCDTPYQYFISNSNWAGLQLSATAEAGKFYILNTSPSLGGSDNNIYVSPVSGSASGSATTTVTDTTVSTTFTSSASGIGSNYDLVYYIKSGATYYKIATTQSGANSYIASADDGDYTLYTCLTDGNITVLKDTDTFTKSSVVKYDVNLHYNGKGGTDYTSQVEENTDFAEPSTGVTGYTLEGWYTTSTFDASSKVIFPLTITGNTDLYAKWTANEYTVTFDYKDGTTAPTTKVVTYNDAYGELPNPTRENYNFGGWYLEEEFTNGVTSTNTVTTADNHTLYAKWTAKEYNITYVLNDGTINGTYANKYTYGVGATLPTDVTKDGYTFKGWYENEGLTGDRVNSISQEATGDKTFYAKWELNVFKHKYVFLDTTKKDWIFSGGCKVYVSFDDGNSYTKMNELFTNNSGYDSTNNNSKLLFAKVPDNTTKFIFRRQDTSDTYNETPYLYSNFNNNNLLTLQDDQTGGNNNIDGSWSTVNYTPVPVSVTHGDNGTVVASKTLADTTTTITVENGKTKYFDASTTGISVTVTPITDYEISSFTINGKDKIESLDTGGTYDLGTLSATEYDIQATFEPKANPTVTIECYDSTGEKITSGVGITVDGGTEALTLQKKTVLYNDSTGATFTANANDENQYKFLGYYTTTTPVGSPIESGGINDYNVTVNGNSIKVYNVKSDLTLYAIFSQQYEVTFNYENLTNFTVDGKAVATGGSVYVSSGANLTLVATISDDYKPTNDFWSITPTGIGTFTSNGLSATYVVGTSDVTITIKPEIATYTGQGKWGSKTLKIDTSSVGETIVNYEPWFAAKFAKSSSGTDETWVRFSKVSDTVYECVVPDGYGYVRFCRMATKATTFTDATTNDKDTTNAWNITNSYYTLGSTNSEYTLAYTGTVGEMSATKK